MNCIEKLLVSISHKFRGKKRVAVLIFIDVVIFWVVNIVYYIASERFDFGTQFESKEHFVIGSLILFVSCFALRMVFRIYRNVWRYPNTGAYLKLSIADGISCVASVLIGRAVGKYNGIWHCITVMSITLLVTLVSRFVYRAIYKRMYKVDSLAKDDVRTFKNVAIVGAGQLGAYLANEISNNYSLGYKVVCLVDADEHKRGNYIYGIKIEYIGELEEVIERYSVDELIIAIDKISNEGLSKIYEHCKALGKDVKIYDSPFMRDNIAEKASTKKIIRDFTIEDLLFRDQIDFLEEEVKKYYNGKTVLITGGGGSIGSEICRQIAKCSPKRIVIFDIYENNAYDIQQELTLKYKDKLDLCVEIGSVRDLDRLNSVFQHYKPDIVFHAAAHKHVPLMEHSACEAIKNNVFGTYNTVNAAEECGVEKFIMVSTDKAVNPTNIMGATKRICEMIVRSHSDSKTCFAAVRFGNVLGSNGSVIPLFKRQIEQGGPVTITDKRIIRYFMTIPEASQLVLTAGGMAKKNELFVLDMGKPVKIYDLCRNMIKLMGYEPDKDIEIKEIGLRDGEKLYEELLVESETLTKTENSRIFVEHDTPFDRSIMAENLKKLALAVEKNKSTLDMSEIVETVHEIVPTFCDPETVNEKAQESKEMKLAGSYV